MGAVKLILEELVHLGYDSESALNMTIVDIQHILEEKISEAEYEMEMRIDSYIESQVDEAQDQKAVEVAEMLGG